MTRRRERLLPGGNGGVSDLEIWHTVIPAIVFLFGCFFSFSRCFGCFCGFSLTFGIVAAHCAATFATGGSLCIGILRVNLFNLALFQAFGHCRANGVEDKLDRLGCVVVAGDYEIDIRGVGVGVDHCEHGDTETVCFGNSDALLKHVDHEQCRGQTVKVGDRTEGLFQFCTLT